MYNNFVVEGEKIALELLKDREIEIENIIATKDWIANHEDLLPRFGAIILEGKEKDLAQISSLKTAPPVIIIAKKPIIEETPTLVRTDLSLYLDRIQNPGNLGTIIRIADWFGIPHVFCSAECADLFNPKTLQSTMGAFLRVKVIVKDFAEIKSDYPQLPVYGTVLEGASIYEKKLSNAGIIVIGSEGKGISDTIRPLINEPISIPLHPNGGAESLNAGVATGIVCALFRKSALSR